MEPPVTFPGHGGGDKKSPKRFQAFTKVRNEGPRDGSKQEAGEKGGNRRGRFDQSGNARPIGRNTRLL